MSKKRTVPVQDLGLNKIPTPEELHSYCQSRIIDDGDDPVLPHGYPYDTDHGVVKVYTEEEIRQYCKQRDWVLEEELRVAREALLNE